MNITFYVQYIRKSKKNSMQPTTFYEVLFCVELYGNSELSCGAQSIYTVAPKKMSYYLLVRMCLVAI